MKYKINIKSIMTLLITAVFCVLSLMRAIDPDKFLVIFTTIVGFYFGAQNSDRNAPPHDTENAKKPTAYTDTEID